MTKELEKELKELRKIVKAIKEISSDYDLPNQFGEASEALEDIYDLIKKIN